MKLFANVNRSGKYSDGGNALPSDPVGSKIAPRSDTQFLEYRAYLVAVSAGDLTLITLEDYFTRTYNAVHVLLCSVDSSHPDLGRVVYFSALLLGASDPFDLPEHPGCVTLVLSAIQRPGQTGPYTIADTYRAVNVALADYLSEGEIAFRPSSDRLILHIGDLDGPTSLYIPQAQSRTVQYAVGYEATQEEIANYIVSSAEASATHFHMNQAVVEAGAPVTVGPIRIQAFDPGSSMLVSENFRMVPWLSVLAINSDNATAPPLLLSLKRQANSSNLRVTFTTTAIFPSCLSEWSHPAGGYYEINLVMPSYHAQAKP